MNRNVGADRVREEERRNSQPTVVEMPVAFTIGKSTFYGTATTPCDHGMMIEASLARKNFLRICKPVVKIHECPVEVRYAIEDRSFSRRGKIKHYHLDFSGGRSAHRLTFRVWIPKMKNEG